MTGADHGAEEQRKPEARSVPHDYCSAIRARRRTFGAPAMSSVFIRVDTRMSSSVSPGETDPFRSLALTTFPRRSKTWTESHMRHSRALLFATLNSHQSHDLSFGSLRRASSMSPRF